MHQGLYLEADPLPSPTLETLTAGALVLALDQITDPHNVGAIVRTAAAFAVDAIVTTARHSPAATGVLAKSASGGLEHVPFVIVRNLAEALIALGERGFQRIGLDLEGDTPLDAVAVRRPPRRWSSAPRAKGCASARRSAATRSAASTCRARSRASTCRMRRRSRSTR